MYHVYYLLLGKLSMSACQILERHNDRFSQVSLPVTIVQMLYTENVITMEVSNELNTLGGVLCGDPMKALCHAVSKDPEKLRVLTSILQKSEETVSIAEDILKEYSMLFLFIFTKFFIDFMHRSKTSPPPNQSSTIFTI